MSNNGNQILTQTSGFNTPVQSPKFNLPSSPSGPSSYQPGLTYLVGPALMELLKDFAEISTLYQKLVTLTTKSGISAAKSIAATDIDLGEKQKGEALVTGLSSIGAGTLTLGMGGLGLYRSNSDSQLDELSQEEKGTRSYKDMIDDEVKKGSKFTLSERTLAPDTDAETKVEVNKLKDKAQFKGEGPSDIEKDAVKKSHYNDKVDLQKEYRKKLEEISRAKQERMAAISRGSDQAMQAAGALGQVGSGIGNSFAGNYKLEQQKDQAKVTVTDTILKGVIQSTDSHFRSQVDKMLDEATQIISALNAISSANKSNG